MSPNADLDEMSTRQTEYARTPTVSALSVFRHARGWTQKVTAERAGIAAETVSRIERGHESPQPRTASKLSTALGVPVELLFPATQTERKQ
jgi:transcriptional regulator with XRE-family HTH domain